MKVSSIDIDYMRSLFSYSAESGILTRIRTASYRNSIKEMTAGTLDKQGYIVIGVLGKLYAAHRIAWALHYGSQPANVIDHINGIKSDNRISNLRDVPDSLNQQNRATANSNNKIGFLGVSKRKNGYIAVIYRCNKQVYLGTYNTPEEASASYIEAKKTIHAGARP